MWVAKDQDMAPLVTVPVDINAKILISWVFCLINGSCSKWTDINFPSAHPTSAQQSYAADGANDLAYAKSSTWLWKTNKAEQM